MCINIKQILKNISINLKLTIYYIINNISKLTKNLLIQVNCHTLVTYLKMFMANSIVYHGDRVVQMVNVTKTWDLRQQNSAISVHLVYTWLQFHSCQLIYSVMEEHVAQMVVGWDRNFFWNILLIFLFGLKWILVVI